MSALGLFVVVGCSGGSAAPESRPVDAIVTQEEVTRYHSELSAKVGYEEQRIADLPPGQRAEARARLRADQPGGQALAHAVAVSQRLCGGELGTAGSDLSDICRSRLHSVDGATQNALAVFAKPPPGPTEVSGWLTSWDAAAAEADARDACRLVFFTAQWSIAAKILERDLARLPPDATASFVTLEVDHTRKGPQSTELVERFAIEDFPALLILDDDDATVARLQDTAQLAALLSTPCPVTP